MTKNLFLFIMVLLPLTASADNVGECGENVSYSYKESTHTLTIFGTGAMKHYTKYQPAPWSNYCSDIENLVVEENVTSIGDYAFYQSGIKNVSIPNSVTYIGRYSFASTELNSITFGNGLSEIGFSAFDKCNKLETIVIPSNVKKIGQSAFTGDLLKKVIIEDSQEELEFHVEYSSSIGFFGPIDSLYLGRNVSCYYTPFNSTTPFNLTIGGNVTRLISNVFVRKVGEHLGIKTLKIENAPTPLYCTNPFYKTPIDSIYLNREIYSETSTLFGGVPSSYSLEIGNLVKEIGKEFSGSNIKKLSIPKSVEKIKTWAFQGCQYLQYVVLISAVA